MTNMIDTQLAALVSIPAALAVIYTVRTFLAYMAGQRDLDRQTSSKIREENATMWGNHLSKSVEAQEMVAVTLQKIVDRLENIERKLG